MSYIYRCSSCRTRNTFPRALASYARGRRCRHCGYTRFYVDRERITRKSCNCSGYHHAHRPGSRCCEHNPAHTYWRAKREGADASGTDTGVARQGREVCSLGSVLG